ncbi:GFA family protein [Microvirga pudoricolor]|uniref:GFA family protein n=1 Tax=Microvirga pudoricolor TaxID=2778729 RepID=UPI00194DC08C|nr:GFA family protein [Microvirga pudoricolor]MBM6595938.1 GFA family protein [Microvirga pudoricolor]
MHQGSCHCGAVTFEVETDLEQVIACNCSHCGRKGLWLAFTPRGAMTITSGEDNLATYTFNTHTIQHRFCKTCGVQPFGEGKAPSGMDTAAINVRCLTDVDLSAIEPVPVDGRNF